MKTSNVSLYAQPREEALSILRQRARVEAQNSEHEGIYIQEEKFYQSFLADYEETMKTLREKGVV